MMKKIFHICLPLLAVLINETIYAQVTISGPGCVISGITYQYVINGKWDSTSRMQACITHGVIQNSTGDNLCTAQGNSVRTILVQWDDTISDSGTVVVTSSSGNATFYVKFTQQLLPGLIDSASKVQLIHLGSIPSIINCLPDSGGSCSPIYSYQWQQSPDQVIWQDITGATSNNLQINSPLTQNTYYRRKVTETVSGVIGYSDAASVFILPVARTNSNDSTSQTGFTYIHQTLINTESVIRLAKHFLQMQSISELRKQETERCLTLQTNCNA